MISFDAVGSKLMSNKENIEMHENIGVIVKYVYNKLLESEKELNKPVIIKDDRFFKPWENRFSKWYWNGNFMDPFLCGVCFQFTVLRDTLSKEKIIDLVNRCQEKLKIKYDFHITDGYYETNNYEESNTKFFRGYCIQTLETLHKPQVQEELKKIKRKFK